MKLPTTPMVSTLTGEEQIVTEQDGKRRLARMAHIKAYLASDPAFKGAKGDPGQSVKGDKGDPGASVKGDKGDPGKDGIGLKGDPGAKGDPGSPGKDGAPGAAGAPKRIERYTGTVVGSTGVATITWTKAFAAPPLGKVIDGWNGDQQITGRVTATTSTTATVTVKRSRGTLLLTTGPYETAPANTVVEIEVVGD